MTPKEIKKTRIFLQNAIKDAHEGLKQLRANCSHVNTFQGFYEWRIGATYNAIICDDCGEVVKNLDFDFNTIANEQAP